MAINPLQKMVQKQAYQIIYWQIAGLIILSAIVLLFKNSQTAFSILAGGLAYTVPDLFFVWRVYRYAGAHQMNQFMASFLIGEMIKLFLRGILFLLVVKYLPVSLLSVLVGFAGAIVLFWIVSIWRFSKKDTQRNNNST